MNKKLTYHHPDSGEVITQTEMLAECFRGQSRFRLMGVAPAGVTVTDEMRQRVADLPAGTLVDVRNPLRRVFPLEARPEMERKKRQREAEIARQLEFSYRR